MSFSNTVLPLVTLDHNQNKTNSINAILQTDIKLNILLQAKVMRPLKLYGSGNTKFLCSL